MSIRSLFDLPLGVIYDGHYSDVFVSMASDNGAIHDRSVVISGECTGDPHGFPALLTVTINRLHMAFHLRFIDLI